MERPLGVLSLLCHKLNVPIGTSLPLHITVSHLENDYFCVGSKQEPFLWRVFAAKEAGKGTLHEKGVTFRWQPAHLTHVSFNWPLADATFLLLIFISWH